MTPSPMDAVDRGILYHLQRDATRPVTDIADALGVADNTVRNRIRNLEQTGVVTGYHADVDYDRAGIQHYYLFVCSAHVNDREALASGARDVPGVVEVLTVMTGAQNVHVRVAAPDKDAITDIAYRLAELGLAIEREHLIWSRHLQPYSGFRLEENL